MVSSFIRSRNCLRMTMRQLNPNNTHYSQAAEFSNETIVMSFYLMKDHRKSSLPSSRALRLSVQAQSRQCSSTGQAPCVKYCSSVDEPEVNNILVSPCSTCSVDEIYRPAFSFLLFFALNHILHIIAQSNSESSIEIPNVYSTFSWSRVDLNCINYLE